MSARIAFPSSSAFAQSLGRVLEGGIDSNDARALIETAKQDLRAKPVAELLGYYSDVFGNQLTKLATDSSAQHILENAAPELAAVVIQVHTVPVEKIPGHMKKAADTIEAFKSWFRQNEAFLPADEASLKLDSLQANLANDGTVFISGTFAEAPNSLTLGIKLAWMFSNALGLEHQGLNKAGGFLFAADTDSTRPTLL